MTEVQVQANNNNHQAMAELGARVANNGYSVMETRALIALIQEAASQTVMNVTPQIMDKVSEIHAARVRELQSRLRQLPASFGYVHRDSVLAVISSVMSSVPQL